MKIFNLNNAPVTPAFLAQVASALEAGEEVMIRNAARPVSGPGIAAFLLGENAGIAVLELRVAALESRLEDIIPTLS